MTKNRLALPRPTRLRRHWLLEPRTVFLNHGSFGACPRAILELQARFRHQMEAEPVQFLWRRYEERLEPARSAVARFVGAKPADLVFVTNATTGVNAVLNSVKLRAGDEVLTTDHDYNACNNVLVAAAKRTGARLVIARVPFPLSSSERVVEAILAAVTRRTRLLLIDHVTSNTALIFPVSQIIRELEARGVDTLVDGAHAPGMLPLNITKLAPAYYAANLHKWVCAPKGAGFLWTRPDKQAGLQPAIISHGNNTHRLGYSAYQDRFDWAGTFDPSAWLCAGAAIEWMSKLHRAGWAGIQKDNHTMAMRARELLCERLQVERCCPDTMLGAMATIPLPMHFEGKPRTGKIDAAQLRLYDRFRIEVPFIRMGKPERRYFRISAQLYNSIEEYEYLATALERL